MNNATCYDYTNIQNSSISLMSNSSFYCQCQKFYVGSYCETKIDICKNETCSNNGNCIDNNSKPKCVCFSMYEGDNCERQSSELKAIKTIISMASIIAFITVASFYLCILLMDLSKYCMKSRGRYASRRNIKKLVYVNKK